jgi:hypothetical protein
MSSPEIQLQLKNKFKLIIFPPAGWADILYFVFQSLKISVTLLHYLIYIKLIAFFMAMIFLFKRKV